MQGRHTGWLFHKAGEWVVMQITAILILLCNIKYLNLSDLVS